MKKVQIFLFVIALVTINSVAQAYVGLCCAKCGGNMPLNIPGGGVPTTKEWRLKVTPMTMKMEDLRNGTDSVAASDILGMPSAGGYMAVPTEMTMNMLNVAAGYSFSDDFLGGVMVMYKDNEMDMLFNSTMQTMTGQEQFTMESSGFGDLMLMGKYRLFTDDPLVPKCQSSLFFGLSLPTGSIDEKNETHPVAMRQSEQLPYGMQLGSGTVDPSIGLLYQSSHSPYWWGVNAIYTARLYDNDRDYHLGDEARLDGYFMYQLHYNFLLQVQLNGTYAGKISGEMDAAVSGASGHATIGDATSTYTTPLWDTDAYGGEKLFTTLGLQWQPVPLHIIDLSVELPIYQDLNGPQLESKYRVMLTWYVEIPTRGSVRHPNYKGKKGDSKLGF